MEDFDKYILTLRRDFSGEPLDENQVPEDPHAFFEFWFKEAVKANVNEPNAMTLSTVNSQGRPTARVVLLREYGAGGYGFYTNYRSRKAKELEENPVACLTFFWPELARQVRIEGKVVRQSNEANDSYFNSRPRPSKVGAWSSPQSQIILNREVLDNLVMENDKKFPGENVPRPDFWGGFLIKPDYMEFWQGRESRLHDRIFYGLSGDGKWKHGRLAP